MGAPHPAALRLVLAGALAGCASVVTPPEHPPAPEAVYLRVVARHTGLILPRAEGGFVEYGYGEYAWYVLGRDGSGDVCRAAFWPTRGALGWRVLEAPTGAELAASYLDSTLVPLVVEGARVAALRSRLERRTLGAPDAPLLVPERSLRFVGHEDDFWMFRTCHDAVADWLRELGCSVSVAWIRTGLAVRPGRGPPG